MPRKRLPMRKIREVLRLKAAGLTIREVAANTGAARTTVYEYLVRAETAGLSWPLPEDMDEEALEALLVPTGHRRAGRRRPVPDWRRGAPGAAQRQARDAAAVLARVEGRATQTAGATASSASHYDRWLGAQDVVMRLSYPAGERMFVDFSGDKVPVTDPATGEVAQAEVFVAVLGCSGMLYVEATPDQALASWLMAHVHAFEAYGGVTVATTPDNLKSGVTKACYYDPEINRSYAELADHYGTVILPTRTYRPRDKAAVEAGVLVVERWVLAPLRKLQFFSLAELNRAIRQKVAELNEQGLQGRAHLPQGTVRGTGTPGAKAVAGPALRAGRVEKGHGQHRLPRRVSTGHYYSRSLTRLVHQKLELRATKATVEVYKAGRRVASHAREYGRRRYITDPAHMPPSHRAHLEWTPSRLVEWARTVSPHAAALAEKMLASRPHPEHSYRACLGLMSLAKRYGNERLGAACERALASGAISYTSVKSILAQGLDRVPLPASVAAPAPPEHENLRGAGY